MPLFWLSLAFLAGVLLAANLPLPAGAWLAGAAVALALPLALRRWGRRSLPFPYAFLPLLALLGAARFQLAQPNPNDPGWVARFNDLDQPVTLTGVALAPAEEHDAYSTLRLRVEQVQLEGQAAVSAHGAVLARLPAGDSWGYGDRLQVRGSLQTPPEDEEFSYRAYLARQGIYGYLPDGRASLVQRGAGNPLLAALYALRARSLRVLFQIFPDPEASLLAGILLGVDSYIPAGVEQAFQTTGTAHIVAISGFNIAIIAGLFASLFGRLFRPRQAAVAALLAIGAYTLLVGASASVVRAAIMGGLSLFARQLGRRQDGLNSLAFTAALMTLFNPQIPWDVGFQLSFLATLGLVLYAAPLEAWFRGLVAPFLSAGRAQRVAALAGEYFLFTLAAQLLTLPATLAYFGRLSLVALLANPVVLPAQPAVMVLGGLAAALGLVARPLGQLAAALAWPCAAFTIRAVEWFASFPQASLDLGRLSAPAALAAYALLFGLTFSKELGAFLTNAAQRLFRARAPGGWKKTLGPGALSGLLLGLLALAAVAWQMAGAAPDGRLRLTVLPAGRGDAVLIQTPSGRYLLVDGGPSPAALSGALGRRLPLLARRLDWVVATNVEPEQIGALASVLERFSPEQLWWDGLPARTAAASRLQQALAAANLVPIQPESGQAFDLGQGARLIVLRTGKEGALLSIEWQNFHAILPLTPAALPPAPETGDILPHVELLLLAPGRGQGETTRAWLDYLQPQLVALSAAAGDPQGYPNAALLAGLEGYSLLRTDRNGWIEIETDGQQMWVQAERQ